MADQLAAASAFARLTSHSADFGPMTLAEGAFWVLERPLLPVAAPANQLPSPPDYRPQIESAYPNCL
jgi:hypothetical protein